MSMRSKAVHKLYAFLNSNLYLCNIQGDVDIRIWISKVMENRMSAKLCCREFNVLSFFYLFITKNRLPTVLFVICKRISHQIQIKWKGTIAYYSLFIEQIHSYCFCFFLTENSLIVIKTPFWSSNRFTSMIKILMRSLKTD